MNIIHEAIRLIDKHSDFDDEIIAVLSSESGILHKTKTSFVIANYNEETGDLLVHFVVGELMELLSLIKFSPKTISFEKHGKLKSYSYKEFISRIKSKEV